MNTIKPLYWAVLLPKHERQSLVSLFEPKHENVYCEHMTICFKPDHEINEKLSKRIGEEVRLTVVGRAFDNLGDALVVLGEDRLNDGVAHITVSCSPGTKPFYSNQLLENGWESVSLAYVKGKIAAYADGEWIDEPRTD